MKRRMLLSAIGSNAPVNLELEGSLSAITTNAQLATFLGVAVSKIRYFTNSGTFIHASIRGNYNIPGSQFLNNTTLTKLRDIGGIIQSVGPSGLRNTALTELVLLKVSFTGATAIAYNLNLNIINLPSLTIWGTQTLRANSGTTHIYIKSLEEINDAGNTFAGLTSLEILDMRSLKIYGVPSTGYGATASGFALLKLGCEIRVHIALATCNAGAVNEALRYAKNLRSAIVKFYDDDGNYVSTL